MEQIDSSPLLQKESSEETSLNETTPNKTAAPLKVTPFKPIYHATCKKLEVIKEMPEETDSFASSIILSFSSYHSKSCSKARKTDYPLKRKSTWLGDLSGSKKAKSCNFSQDSFAEVTFSISQSSVKSVKESPEKADENYTIKEMEIEKVADPNYKNRGNFAILKLTPKTAKRSGCELVATPLRPYSVDKVQRTAALQGICCGICSANRRERIAGSGHSVRGKYRKN